MVDDDDVDHDAVVRDDIDCPDRCGDVDADFDGSSCQACSVEYRPL